MNYVIGNWPNTRKKQENAKPNNPFLVLKEQLAGKLTNEVMVNDGLSGPIRWILRRMGIQKVPVLKNGIDYVTVEINKCMSDLPIEDKVSINDSVFVESTNRWHIIMRSREIHDAIELAKTIEKRQNIVSRARELTRWKGPQTNKVLFNNLLREAYTKSNQETFFDTIIEWEELIWKVTSVKPMKDFNLVTIHFNDNCFWKILVDKDNMGYVGDRWQDLKYQVWDYWFVRVLRKWYNRFHKKEIDLKFTHDDITLINDDWVRQFAK